MQQKDTWYDKHPILTLVIGAFAILTVAGIAGGNTNSDDFWEGDDYQMIENCARHAGEMDTYDYGMSEVSADAGTNDGDEGFYTVELYDSSGGFITSCSVEMTPTSFKVQDGPY